MLRGIPPAVPRSAEIDFRTAGESLIALEKIYARDLDADEMSDDGIAAVNTAIRAIEGAMGKVAHAVYELHCTKRAKTYFPLTNDPARFVPLLENNLPGLRDQRPDVAEVFERHQPYQDGKATLGLLKSLYRQNHHHDFTVQERKESDSTVWTVFPGMEFSITGDSITIGSPRWKGVPLEQISHEGLGMTLTEGAWVDWYFVEPNVSVLETLISLYNLSAEACNEVSESAAA